MRKLNKSINYFYKEKTLKTNKNCLIKLKLQVLIYKLMALCIFKIGMYMEKYLVGF